MERAGDVSILQLAPHPRDRGLDSIGRHRIAETIKGILNHGAMHDRSCAASTIQQIGFVARQIDLLIASAGGAVGDVET